MRHGLAQRGVAAHTGALLCGVALVFTANHACAAELEPRAYVNTPVGLNFLIAGYAYSEGGLSTSASPPIKDAHLRILTEFLAYARTLDVWGKSGKFDVIVPYSQLSGTAMVHGQRRARRGRAEEFACGGHPGTAREPEQLDQTLRQHRRIHPHRKRLQPRRDRLAIPLGRWAVTSLTAQGGFPRQQMHVVRRNGDLEGLIYPPAWSLRLLFDRPAPG